MKQNYVNIGQNGCRYHKSGEDVFCKEDFEEAVKRLLTKTNSCGADGILISEFEEYWRMNGVQIFSLISEGKYKPSPVILEEIMFKAGKKRLISKYTCTDRVILDVLKVMLTPLYKDGFSEYSFAYVENKGTEDASKYAANLIGNGKKFVAELDVKDFFENINLQRLEHFLETSVEDLNVKKLIHDYLYIFVIVDGRKERKTIGLVQGSPLSPLFSNVYMTAFDKYMEAKYSFCRFADNINVYCETEEEAKKAYEDVEKYLKTKLGLDLNQKKSGVYPAVTRSFLGYGFKQNNDSSTVSVIRNSEKKSNYYGTWHASAIQKTDKDYHIISDGILNRKDFTILFEEEKRKVYIPVESCASINIYSNVYFGKSFLEYANEQKLIVNMFDKYGNFLGSFHSENHYMRSAVLLKQATFYNDIKRRTELAIKIEQASLHNERENLRYFYKHTKKESLKAVIDILSDCIDKMKKAVDVNEVMMVEARAKQKYLQAFDEMIDNPEFVFEKRTKRPPQNAVNALISFGNTFLYRRIANEIYKTALDIRIGIVHSANNRSESLNLDIAEIFKPVIVDKTIFSVIHNLQLHSKTHFEITEEGGVYLNNIGRRIFINEMEDKLNDKLSVNGQKITYDRIIKNEIHKILDYIENGEKYKPFKYT